MNKIFTLLLILILGSNAFAFELDMSVDDEIRKNYNPNAIEHSLPSLPKTTPTSSPESVQVQPPKALPVTEQSTKIQIGVKNLPNSNYKIDKSTAIRIKKGTKFRAKSSAYLSDKTKEGARLTFTTISPITQRYITIPTGTSFSAVVTNSHTPQITGNGGLLEILVDGMKYNGKNYYAHGKITKVNHKKVFVNNIKGKRKYWKGVETQIQKGQGFYNRSRRTSSMLAENPIGLILAPIPTVVGAGVYAINLVGSPIFSIGSKGGGLSIPAGTEFEIKLLQDIYIE